MAPDKYTAVWVSHSSIADFLTCPRAYYLKNVYKDPATGHKVQVIGPPLALGSAVHEVIESLSVLTVKDRFRESLLPKFDLAWAAKYGGKRGGFLRDLAAKGQTSQLIPDRFKQKNGQATYRPDRFFETCILINTKTLFS